MTMSDEDRRVLEELERRLLTLLPEEYRDSYEDVQPVSMGSAALRYGADGQVAWNAMWDTFCNLALAGGPPHKGTLLEPASRRAIEANPGGYAEVISHICRGIEMVTGLDAAGSPHPGWVRVECSTDSMAAWLVRAIAMENIAVRAEGPMLELPAGPDYRIEKEIKNVVTAIAKATHYWLEHMSLPEWRAVGALLEGMNEESALVEPPHDREGADVDAADALAGAVADAVHRNTGLKRSPHRVAGWIGFECGSVRAAVWMMRMMATVNVLSRREDTVLFVPINPAIDPDGTTVADSVTLIHRLAAGKGVC